MAFNFNGNTPKKILYNGLNVAKLVYNGVVVWMSKVLATISGILPLTLTDCTGDDLVDYKIYGNSEQVLPDGYTQVEYLESTGTQYIDTNFIPNQDTRIKVKIMTKDISGMTNKTVFGSRESATSKHYGVTMGNGSQNSWWTGYGTSSIGTNSYALRDTLYEIEKNKNVTILNGSVLATNESQTFTCSSNLYLFCMNQGGPTFYSNIELYYCKIWENGVLVRNMIPCKNPSNVVGMYDTVNGVFYTNAGKGTFNTGSVVSKKSVGDLVTDTSDINYGKYKIPILTNSTATNIYLNKPLRKTSKLPTGYTELEHIRSTGTQYINTGIKATEKTMVKAKLYTEEAGNKNWLGGTGQYNASYNFAFNSFSINQFEYSYGSSNWTRITISEEIVNRDFTVEFGNGAIKINDSLKVTLPNTAFTDNKDLCIFVRNGGTGNIAGRVYYLKIYEAGVLVRNFIPCKNPSNVVGLYDTVNGVFYTNAGTGSFIAGAEVETVYYTDYLDYENQKVVRNVDDNDKGLDTPVEESVVLPAVATDEGTVTVDVDTVIAPSNMEVVYYKNGS